MQFVETRDVLYKEYAAQCAQQGLNLEVFSDGPVNSSVALVGDGPGEQEIRQRSPFVGGAGRILWDALRRHGLHRANVYTTNVVKRQISLSAKGNDKHVVHGDELDKWCGLVNWELSKLPNVRTIFAMGGTAIDALAGESGVLNWRGSVLDRVLPNGKNGKIICTINPAFTQRDLRFEVVFQLDCNKLDQVVRNVFKPHEIKHIINPSYKEAREYIRMLKRDIKPVALDIEWINQEIACYGLSNNSHEAICINLRDHKDNRYTLREEADILYDLQDLCDSQNIVTQNGNFDAYASRLGLLLCIKSWADTLLAHHTLYPQLPHSLAFITAQYSSHPFYKDEGKTWKEGGDINQFWRYNCKDAALTYHAFVRMYKELKEQGLEDFYFKHVMRAQPHLVSSTVHGVKIDLTARKRINELCSEDVAKKAAEFHRLVQELTDEPDYCPNPQSWQQLQVLFFDKLKLKGRGKSTDENNRKLMMQDANTSPLAREMLVALDSYKEEAKFFGTYVESKASNDGRFRCEYKQFGVTRAPGRLSSSQLLSGEGGNMQNQPIRARGMYEADPGCVFGYFDLSQAEAQVVAYRADIAKWKQQFERSRLHGDYDCHRALASEMYNIPYAEVPTIDADEDGRPTLRYIAKRCRHGLNYRMQKYRLAQVTGLPYHTASRAFVIYHKITPELVKWWDEETKRFKATREIYNALGRRLKVIQRIDDDVQESIIAFYPQSTIGDKVTQVWYQAEEDDDWPMDARVAINVHDSLTCMVVAKEKTIKTALRVLKKHAESPVMVQDVYKRRPPQPLIIPAELKISEPTSWDDKTRRFVPDKQGAHRWSNMIKYKL